MFRTPRSSSKFHHVTNPKHVEPLLGGESGFHAPSVNGRPSLSSSSTSQGPLRIASITSQGGTGTSQSGPSRKYLFQVEQVHVGDEHGVQGRLQQRVGQTLSVIAAQREVDFAFGDFKCVVSPYIKVPDCMIMSQFGAAKVVGEVKTPWVPVHNLTRKVTSADFGQEGPFRQYLGKQTVIIRYITC